jgi:hypothetical protein
LTLVDEGIAELASQAAWEAGGGAAAPLPFSFFILRRSALLIAGLALVGAAEERDAASGGDSLRMLCSSGA